MKVGKEVRALLTVLAQASIVSMQEVPKGADRAPSRTFYLWYVNHDAVNENLIASQVCRPSEGLCRSLADAVQNIVQHFVPEKGGGGRQPSAEKHSREAGPC